MRVTLLSRYPRVDAVAWKRTLGERLVAHGAELSIVYTHSGLVDQARAGLAEYGAGVIGRYVGLRRNDADAAASTTAGDRTETLAAWGAGRGVPVFRHDRLDEPGLVARLRELAPELLVLAGAGIVPAPVLEIPSLGTLNGHFGLLPRYRGMNVAEWSVYQDDPVGVSVHLVDPGIDTGAIVAREPLTVAPGDDLAAIRVRQREMAARMLADGARSLADRAIEPKPQAPGDGRQYYRMHPVLRERVEARLREGAYRWIGVPAERLAVGD